MSDGEGLGSGQSMNRNPPRNRTPPQTAPLPSSELPQLAPPPSGGVRWMDRSTDNRGVGAPPPPPAPRPPARPPRPRHPSNQRPAASPPDEDFPRLADGRVIQVPTQEIVGQVPQRDVAPERATVGQRGTADPQWRQIIQDRYEERDRIQGIFAYSIPETNQTHLTRRGWPIGTTRQGSGYLLPNGIFVLPNVDGTPFIDPRTGRITSPRRSGVSDETFPARQAIASLNESLSDFAQEHRTDPHAQDFGIVIGSIEEFLVIADGILALPESIAELISLLPRIGSIYMDFQRLPEDEQVQVLGALAREGANAIFGEIIRLARESIQDSINGRTLDANRKATRAIIKVVTLVAAIKGAIRFLRRSPEIFSRISGKIEDLGRRGRRLADRFSESARELGQDQAGSYLSGNPELRRVARNLRNRVNRRISGTTTRIHDYIQNLLNSERNVRVRGSSFEIVRRRLTPDEVQSLIDSVFNFYDRVGRRLSNDADTFLELLKNFTDTRFGSLRITSTISRPAAGELKVLTEFLYAPNVRTVHLVPQGPRRSPDIIITPNRGSRYRVEVRTMDSFFARANPNRSIEALRRAILDKIERGQLTAPLSGRFSRTPRNGEIAIVVPSDPSLYPLIDQAMEGFSFPPGINRILFFAGDNIFTFTPQ